MKPSILKVLINKSGISEESRAAIAGILDSAGSAENLSDSETEHIRGILEAELKVSDKIIEGYQNIGKQLDIAIAELEAEEKEAAEG
ncbi:hypothetical protein L0Y34_00605 [Candidatus Parcubacteria bacterium]|nr:hypothetical protein [Candidatus Parcubacteria bacterium]